MLGFKQVRFGDYKRAPDGTFRQIDHTDLCDRLRGPRGGECAVRGFHPVSECGVFARVGDEDLVEVVDEP